MALLAADALTTWRSALVSRLVLLCIAVGGLPWAPALASLRTTPTRIVSFDAVYDRVLFVRDGTKVVLASSAGAAVLIYDPDDDRFDAVDDLTHSVVDMSASPGGEFVFVAGNSRDGAAVSRIDLKRKSAVSRVVTNIRHVGAVAAGPGRTAFVSDLQSGLIVVFDSSSFDEMGIDQRTNISQQSIIGEGGIAGLAVIGDGSLLLTYRADGSLLSLIDTASGKIKTAISLPASGVKEQQADARSADVASRIFGSDRTDTSSVVVGRSEDHSAFIFDYNQTFGKLDLTQKILLDASRTARTEKSIAVGGATPRLVVASDDAQRWVLIGSEDMGRILVLSRTATGIEKRGELPVPGILADIDVASDGRAVAILERTMEHSSLTVARLSFTQARYVAERTLSAENVKVAQEVLSRMGYFAGLADGLVGPKTRLAIERFQEDRGLKVTGQVDDRTFQMLLDGEIASMQSRAKGEVLAGLESESIDTLLRLGQAAILSWESLGNLPAREIAIDAFRRAADIAQRVGAPGELIALASNNFCWALANAGWSERDTVKLVEALNRCETALLYINVYNEPDIWMSAEHSRGFALWKLGEVSRSREYIEEAIRAFEKALDVAEADTMGDDVVERIRTDMSSTRAALARIY